MQPMDTDLIRLKLEKEIEATYISQIDDLKNQLDQLNDNYNTMKRDRDMIKTQFETQKY